MSSFSLRRFGRLLLNDALRLLRPTLYGTGAFFGLTLLTYLLRFSRARGIDDPVHIAMFGFCLIGAGVLLTSICFQDMHHPLERYQHLMLPVSSFERLLSRYLLTGPVFIAYGLLAFTAMDRLANLLTGMWINERQLLFSPFAAESMLLVRWYFAAHIVAFIGAICFRSHALLKTTLVVVLLFFSLLLVENAAGRAFFPELYSWTQFDGIGSPPVDLQPSFTAAWMNVAFCIGLLGWLIHVAWLCLRDHEVTDGV